MRDFGMRDGRGKFSSAHSLGKLPPETLRGNYSGRNLSFQEGFFESLLLKSSGADGETPSVKTPRLSAVATETQNYKCSNLNTSCYSPTKVRIRCSDVQQKKEGVSKSRVKGIQQKLFQALKVFVFLK